MRVLAFSDVAPPQGGGGVEHTLAELYPRLVARGAQVWLVSLGGAGLPWQERRDGVTILRAQPVPLERLTGAQTAFSAAVWGLGAAAAARFRPDVVHAHTLFYHTSLVAAAVARAAGVPLVLTLHLGAVDALPQPYRVLTRLYERTAGRALLAAAARIICVSHDVRRHALALGAPPARLVVVPNGVDAARFAPMPIRGAATAPEKEATIRLLAVGRLIFNKGQHHLLEALAELRRDGYLPPPGDRGARSGDSPVRGLRLVLAGEGPLAGRLQRQATRLGIADLIEFAGYREDIAALLHEADIFVRPSLSEGMSLAVLEAMAAGLPVIATDVSGTRELLHDGESGLIVPPGSARALATAIARLAADTDLRQRLGTAARRRALAYDWERVADRTLEELHRAPR